MSIKEKVKKQLRKNILDSVVKCSSKSMPVYIYEVPKPDNYEELVKKVKENYPELNQ